MSEAIEKARRRIEQLEREEIALERGLPSHLGVIVYSGDPTHIEDAVSAKLSPYGLSTVQEAVEAGCEFSVLCLPYCKGRIVDKTEPGKAQELRNAGKGADNEAQRIDNPQASNDQSAAIKGFHTEAVNGEVGQLPTNFPQ